MKVLIIVLIVIIGIGAGVYFYKTKSMNNSAAETVHVLKLNESVKVNNLTIKNSGVSVSLTESTEEEHATVTLFVTADGKTGQNYYIPLGSDSQKMEVEGNVITIKKAEPFGDSTIEFTVKSAS